MMSLGDAQVAAILYRFWRGRLSDVLIGVEGQREGEALLDAALVQFGDEDAVRPASGDLHV